MGERRIKGKMKRHLSEMLQAWVWTTTAKCLLRLLLWQMHSLEVCRVTSKYWGLSRFPFAVIYWFNSNVV